MPRDSPANYISPRRLASERTEVETKTIEKLLLDNLTDGQKDAVKATEANRIAVIV